MIEVMHFVDEKMRHSVLLQRVDKIKRRMVCEPQMVKGKVEDRIRQPEFLLDMLPHDRCLSSSFCAFETYKPITPIYFGEKITFEIQIRSGNQPVGNLL